MKNPREVLNSFIGGLEEVSKTNEEHMGAFMNLMGTSYAAGELDIKFKELISVAIGVYNRCEYCIVFHTYKAMEAGATREELMEAAMVAAAFGGGPTVAYSVTILRDAINEFENDF
ncbi:alkyl hydroperoxide reductase AhpD [Propionigenium maris DSM 9537]|uniref:Alkyl hydroperoxide reductase AhpD n=1 Tax=Propionigenium maris DSM 9537 TaxID=1123000 RepID=A0A9W6GPV2_9FUSO|nr:carboxymuconolactone decarboxylase family protein [Propionigenium maris]GLI58080.1 alkyl hydroperoxide reductase AhpD [Propionigenium maris DSM 9537]